MEKLGHETLITWSSMAELKGRKPRRLRPRTVAYAGLLTGIAATVATLLAGRVPFDAAVNRAPGMLFTMDADGFVRNTYLLRITNKEPSAEAVPFHVRVEGLPGAEVLVQDVRLGTTESATVPMIIRVPAADNLPRTIPIAVHVASPGNDLRLDATFKTEGHIDGN
jgi:polyferredoxin